MAEDNPLQQNIAPNTSHVGILDQTLGDILQNNPQAQQMITKSMGITQEKFQEMLTSAQQNNMMHMKIGDLFKNGIVQQAVEQQNPSASSGPMQVMQQQKIQLTPEQARQLQNGTLSPQQLVQQAQPVQEKTSFLDKVRKLFR